MKKININETRKVNGGDGKTGWDCLYAFGKVWYDLGYSIGLCINYKIHR